MPNASNICVTLLIDCTRIWVCSVFLQSPQFAAGDIAALKDFRKKFLHEFPVTLEVWQLSFQNAWWLCLDDATFPSPNVCISIPLHFGTSMFISVQFQAHHTRWMMLLHQLQGNLATVQHSFDALNILIMAKEMQLDGLVMDCTAETLVGDKATHMDIGNDGSEMNDVEGDEESM